MITTTVFPGRYIQGYKAIDRLEEEIARFGKSAILICSPTVYNKLLPTFRETIEKSVRIEPVNFKAECCEPIIEQLYNQSKDTSCEVVVGMGGGKTLDTAKAVADKLGRPLIIVPTVASSDAPCSGTSVIYTPEGVMIYPLRLLRNPDVILVDTNIIANAPVRFLVAGMGDALATWFEAESCQITCAPNKTGTGDSGAQTSYALAHLCYQRLLQYGAPAKKACELHVVTPALEHIIETNTLLSGMGFESCGLAAAHAIQIGFTNLEATHNYLHGEVVSFCTLASLLLTDKPAELIDEVFTFCESVGLPTTLAEIGLADVTEEDLQKVADIICDDVEGEIHNEPVKVTPEMIIAAIRATDDKGKSRKH